VALGRTRIAPVGETPYAHEREAIEHVLGQLPDTDPYFAWPLAELLDPSTGRLHEIDLLVLGYSALYLVEIKSGPGKYTGDAVDWWRTPPEETARWMAAPYRLANSKARILRSRLETKLRGERGPWIQALVFLSHPDADIKLDEEGRIGVVTRTDVRDAIVRNRFPGARSDVGEHRVNAPQARAVIQAMAEIGIRPRKGKAYVGSYELGDILLEGPGYHDRVAIHRDQPTLRRRARIYQVPDQTSVERRQQLRRAADREARLLEDVREHPSILRCTDYVTDAPLGPTVLFEEFERGVPLDVFLRQESPTFLERIELLQAVGLALTHCHRKQVVHGNLSPEAVLCRRGANGRVEVRLFDFQLGHGEDVESTRHWSLLSSEEASVYMAPELRDGASPRSSLTDVFSFGALAYFALTGRAPGATPAEIDERLQRDGHLDPRAADDGIPEGVAEVVREATKLRPPLRLDEVEFIADRLEDAATAPETAAKPAEADPLVARPTDRLAGGFVVTGILGHGATSRVLLVERGEREFALKVSLSEGHDERLRNEGDVLQKLRHPRIVQCYEILVMAGRTALLLSVAGGETLQRQLTREGSASLDYAARYGEDLLSALEHLEEADVIHRDVKPANLGVGGASKTAHRLTLFDFSLVRASLNELRVGTAAYRDPDLPRRGCWDAAADRWSAAVTLVTCPLGSGWPPSALTLLSAIDLPTSSRRPSLPTLRDDSLPPPR
jgi:serine/threonine protein kinase